MKRRKGWLDAGRDVYRRCNQLETCGTCFEAPLGAVTSRRLVKASTFFDAGSSCLLCTHQSHFFRLPLITSPLHRAMQHTEYSGLCSGSSLPLLEAAAC